MLETPKAQMPLWRRKSETSFEMRYDDSKSNPYIMGNQQLFYQILKNKMTLTVKNKR